ncbi:MAG: ABC transporter permease [Bryobacterales bacterium]
MACTLSVDPGFDPKGAMLVEVRPPHGMKREALPAFYAEIERSIAAVPGVESFAGVNYPLLGRVYTSINFRLPESLETGREESRVAHSRIVTPGFFAMMRIPIVAGKTFDGAGTEGATQVAINRTFAERTWPGENPVGKTIILYERTDRSAQVAAVVEDAHARDHGRAAAADLSERRGLPQPTHMALRAASGDPRALLPAVQDAIRQVDPTQPFSRTTPLEELMVEQTVPSRASTCSCSPASLLWRWCSRQSASTAWSPRGRAQNPGDRRAHMALGADRPRILRMFAAEGLLPAAAGVAAGLAGALALSRFLEAWLYDVSLTDPLTLIAVRALLAAVAWLASYLPARARRASTL